MQRRSAHCAGAHACAFLCQVRAARGLPDDLVRISAGIEGAMLLCGNATRMCSSDAPLCADADDLIADLAAAMDEAVAATSAVKAAAPLPAASADTDALMARLRHLEEQLGQLNARKP